MQGQESHFWPFVVIALRSFYTCEIAMRKPHSECWGRQRCNFQKQQFFSKILIYLRGRDRVAHMLIAWVGQAEARVWRTQSGSPMCLAGIHFCLPGSVWWRTEVRDLSGELNSLSTPVREYEPTCKKWCSPPLGAVGHRKVGSTPALTALLDILIYVKVKHKHYISHNKKKNHNVNKIFFFFFKN